MSPLKLLQDSAFRPLFFTQFLGAFNDNLFKNGLVMLLTFGLAEQAGYNVALLLPLAAGIFILPFFLFSATAGYLADRSPKASLIRTIKLLEIALMVLAGLGFYLQSIPFLMLVLFAMGAQSSFFGPIKYSILPEILSRDKLLPANALVEAGTFLAILLGTICGGLLATVESGIWFLSTLLVLVAFVGWWTGRQVPDGPAANPSLQVGANFLKQTMAMLSLAAQQTRPWRAILGISWFWLVGATFLTQFPTLVKNHMGGDAPLVTLFLTLFSVGIGVGSIWCNRLQHSRPNTTYAPFGALALSLFTFDFYVAMGQWSLQGPVSLHQFIMQPEGWRIMLDLFGVSVAGGIFVVPLYTLLQTHGKSGETARLIASNNILNALFMVVSSLLAMGMLAMGWSIPELFLSMAIANLFVTAYIVTLLPNEVLMTSLRMVLRLLFRVQLHGLDNLKKAGDNPVIVVNHVSFLDALLLAAFLPIKPYFAINTHMAQRWWLKPFLPLFNAYPLDPTNPLALRGLTRAVQQGNACIIFPEGRITVTGSLMKVFEGPGLIADRAHSAILPIRIDGAQYTFFSRLKGVVRRRLFPAITLSILPPQRISVDASIVGRERRKQIALSLYDILTEMLFETSKRDQTLFQALRSARDIHGGSGIILEDIQRKPMSYDRLYLSSLVMAGLFNKVTKPHARVGVLLPNTSAVAATFFGLQYGGRVPAMLNFSAGPAHLQSAVHTAQLKQVITSRKFIEMGKLEPLLDALSSDVEVLYLEELTQNITVWQKAWAWLLAPMSGWLHAWKAINPHDPAVVLFTSGSEGNPKGVVLSHHNLLSNCAQMGARVDYSPKDVVFNALPVFHAFGLSAGFLMPVFSGIRSFLYPSPLHYRIVPELVYDSNATILFGTDTFLAGYARMANPYDFYSVRFVFAGAEAVKAQTRQLWMERFGLRILEGYGATETAPVLAINTAMHNRSGSVGRLMPGMEMRLDPVPGIDEGGQLWVKGPNVMLGYLKTDAPGQLQPVEGGWYDTGDIVDMDEEGFMRIKGRVKRFAKIAGEMVSLQAVENLVALIYPDQRHAVVARPDEKKGERLVLVSEVASLDITELGRTLRAQGVAEIQLPRHAIHVQQLPLLGSGKTDYTHISNLVKTQEQQVA
ncbi:acyl-[ACP]--phospholipid O-acyltransferase [Magnetococcus sp. PR-3]|uniref:acyl-[ACP]--phospholipid O-acyltransferase n=1 Tax=Magnetococcus sp. PR-3 TaxID=3120355 RepID=UPI002FCDF011